MQHTQAFIIIIIKVSSTNNKEHLVLKGSYNSTKKNTINRIANSIKLSAALTSFLFILLKKYRSGTFVNAHPTRTSFRERDTNQSKFFNWNDGGGATSTIPKALVHHRIILLLYSALPLHPPAYSFCSLCFLPSFSSFILFGTSVIMVIDRTWFWSF